VHQNKWPFEDPLKSKAFGIEFLRVLSSSEVLFLFIFQLNNPGGDGHIPAVIRRQTEELLPALAPKSSRSSPCPSLSPTFILFSSHQGVQQRLLHLEARGEPTGLGLQHASNRLA
jgi:hypothetical protein